MLNLQALIFPESAPQPLSNAQMSALQLELGRTWSRADALCFSEELEALFFRLDEFLGAPQTAKVLEQLRLLLRRVRSAVSNSRQDPARRTQSLLGLAKATRSPAAEPTGMSWLDLRSQVDGQPAKPKLRSRRTLGSKQ